MITKQMEDVCEDTDFVTAKKLCQGVFGFEPKFLPHGSSARRNLFGSEDERESNSETIVDELLSEVTKEMAERSARVWNFDFMTETPLEGGRYLWEKVTSCDVPDWYTRIDKSTKSTNAEKYRSSGTSSGEKENTVLVRVRTNNGTASRGLKCNTKSNKLVQTNIRGWARVQKRRRTSTRLRLKRLDDTSSRLSTASRLPHYILRGPAKSS